MTNERWKYIKQLTVQAGVYLPVNKKGMYVAGRNKSKRTNRQADICLRKDIRKAIAAA